MQWGPGCTYVLEIWCRDLSWIQRDLYISLGDMLEAELDKQTAFLDAEEMHLSWATLPGPSKLSIEALTIQCWVQGMSNRQSVQNVGAAHKAFSLLPSVHHIWMRNLPSKLGSEAQLSLPLRLLSNSTHFYLHSSLEMQTFQKHKANRRDSSNVLLPPPNNTKHDILKQNWVSVRSKITGCRLLLIPCKQTGDLYKDSEHVVALSLTEQLFWGFCSIRPLRIYLHSRQNLFPPFHVSVYLYVAAARPAAP